MLFLFTKSGQMPRVESRDRHADGDLIYPSYPEFITLINSLMNSGFIPTFQARSNRRKMMKNPSLRVPK